MNIRIMPKQTQGILLSFIGCLILPYYIRELLLTSKWASFNFFAVIGTFMCIYYGLQNKKIYIGNRNILITFIILLSTIFLLIQYSNNSSVLNSIKSYFALILPIFISYIRIEKEQFDLVFHKCLKLINFTVFIIFTMLIIDLLTNKSASQLFANLLNDTSFTAMVNAEGRYGSLLGHYIFTAEIYVIYYILNSINITFYKANKSRLLILIISVIGVALTASKSNIIILICLIVIFNAKKIRYLIMSIIGIIVIYTFNGFDNIISRFTSGELTTGRDTTWEFLISRYGDLLPLFWGHGASSVFALNTTTVISWASAAFEYPIRLFSYEYGIVFTVLLYIILFFIPFVITIRNRNITILASLVLIFLDVNFYNGIGLYQDHMFVLCLTVFLLINLSFRFSNISVKRI